MNKPTPTKTELLFRKLEYIRELEEERRVHIYEYLNYFEMKYLRQAEMFQGTYNMDLEEFLQDSISNEKANKQQIEEAIKRQTEMENQRQTEMTANGQKVDLMELVEPLDSRKWYHLHAEISNFETTLIEVFFDIDGGEKWPQLFFIHGMFLKGNYHFLESRINKFNDYLPEYEDRIPTDDKQNLSSLLKRTENHFKLLRFHFSQLDRYSPQLHDRLDLATYEEVLEVESPAAESLDKRRKSVSNDIRLKALKEFAPELISKLRSIEPQSDAVKIIHLITGTNEGDAKKKIFGNRQNQVDKVDFSEYELLKERLTKAT